MRKVSPFAFALIALAMILPAKAADSPASSISTTGEATVYVVPDKVVVSLGIETFNYALDAAKSANESTAAKLLKAISDLGIKPTEISTANLQVEIRYHDGRIENGIGGFVVRRGFAITLKDTKLFEKLVDTALNNGANTLSDISFQTTELRKYRDQARQMAVHAAKEKAQALAKELDSTVGKPRTITESNGSYYFSGYRGGNNNAWAQNGSQSVEPAQSDTGESLPLGQIAVQATVEVTFDLN